MAPALGFETAAIIGGGAQESQSSSTLSWQGTQSALDGCPIRLDAALAWEGCRYQNEKEYIFQMTEQEVLEVKLALQSFKAKKLTLLSPNDLQLDGQAVNRSNFRVPAFERRLSELAKDLHKGKGFIVVRGLNVTEYSLEDNIIIFLGISSYVGEKRGKQDHDGNMLMHICNASNMGSSQEERPARDSNLGLSFHADLWTDLVALQTLSCAAVGGNHVIAPAYTIYNELAITRPDLLEVLMRPDWTFDERSLHHTSDKRPLVAYHGGRVLFNFGRLHVFGDDDASTKAVKSELSPKQVESLELLQELARKHQLSLSLQPGDLCFLNNFAILHSREAFQDTMEKRRHLVRLWLKNESLAWKLPPHLEQGNSRVFYHDDDDGVEERWEILPAPRLTFKIRDKFSP